MYIRNKNTFDSVSQGISEFGGGIQISGTSPEEMIQSHQILPLTGML